MTVEEWVKFALSSNVVAALVVGGFGIFTLKMGLGKFRSEKWWERKAAAYVSTIEAMHGMFAYTSGIIEEAGSDYELADDYKATLHSASTAGMMELRKAGSIGPLLMSKAAAEVVAHLIRELDGQRPDIEPIIDFHRERKNLLSNAIAKMTYQARRDLRT